MFNQLSNKTNKAVHKLCLLAVTVPSLTCPKVKRGLYKLGKYFCILCGAASDVFSGCQTTVTVCQHVKNGQEKSKNGQQFQHLQVLLDIRVQILPSRVFSQPATSIHHRQTQRWSSPVSQLLPVFSFSSRLLLDF